MFSASLEFVRRFGVTNSIRDEIDNADLQPVLHFAFAEIM